MRRRSGLTTLFADYSELRRISHDALFDPVISAIGGKCAGGGDAAPLSVARDAGGDAGGRGIGPFAETITGAAVQCFCDRLLDYGPLSGRDVLAVAGGGFAAADCGRAGGAGPAVVPADSGPEYAPPVKIDPAPKVNPAPAAAPSLADRLRSISWAVYYSHVLAIYLLGVAFMLVRLVLALWGGQMLRRKSKPVEDPVILAALARQAKALGLAFTPAVACCREIVIPTVIGILRPMVLLPISLATMLSPEQIEVILAHELAHIRRYDHLVNLIQRVVEAFLFFHPGVWYVSRRLRIEREQCCDDRVLAAGGRATAYADSLVCIAQQCLAARSAGRVAAVALGAADRTNQLSRRIGRLLGVAGHEQVRLTRVWGVMLLVGVAGSVSLTVFAVDDPKTRRAGDLPAVFSQSTARPAGGNPI